MDNCWSAFIPTGPCLRNGCHRGTCGNYLPTKSYGDCRGRPNPLRNKILTNVCPGMRHVPWTCVRHCGRRRAAVMIGTDDKIAWPIDSRVKVVVIMRADIHRNATGPMRIGNGTRSNNNNNNENRPIRLWAWMTNGRCERGVVTTTNNKSGCKGM